MKISIIVNGNVKEFEKNINITGVLKTLSLKGKVMAAAVNMNIVKQNSWETYVLQDGDKLELLDFVGGG